MKAKRHQVLVEVQSRLSDTFVAPGGTVFYNYQHEALSTHNVTQIGTVLAVGEDVEGVEVGDEVFFRWTVTHDEDNHILYGETDCWAVNCIVKYGIPDLFAVITGGNIKPVCGFAFVEPLEETVGFGEYQTTRRSESWGIVRYADSKDVNPGEKVFFGSEGNDNADLNTVCGKQYYIMESKRILLKEENE